MLLPRPESPLRCVFTLDRLMHGKPAIATTAVCGTGKASTSSIRCSGSSRATSPKSIATWCALRIHAPGASADALAAALVEEGAGLVHFAEARVGLQASFEALVDERRAARAAGGAA